MMVSHPLRNRAETMSNIKMRNHAETILKLHRNRTETVAETTPINRETISHIRGKRFPLLRARGSALSASRRSASPTATLTRQRTAQHSQPIRIEGKRVSYQLTTI